MDYLKASDIYKAIKIGGDKPSKVYRIMSEDKSKWQRSYVRTPRRAWYRSKDRNLEAGILIFLGALMLILALAGPRVFDRLFGVISLFILLVVGVLV